MRSQHYNLRGKTMKNLIYVMAFAISLSIFHPAYSGCIPTRMIVFYQPDCNHYYTDCKTCAGFIPSHDVCYCENIGSGFRKTIFHQDNFNIVCDDKLNIFIESKNMNALLIPSNYIGDFLEKNAETGIGIYVEYSSVAQKVSIDLTPQKVSSIGIENIGTPKRFDFSLNELRFVGQETTEYLVLHSKMMRIKIQFQSKDDNYCKIVILNSAGQTILEKTNPLNSDLDISFLNSGFYAILVKDLNGNIIGKDKVFVK